MSKYDPLLHHLQHSTGAVELQFRDVEEILAFPLPPSARRHAAWWSNSGGTHVQSLAWQTAGYRTEDIDIENESVRFVPDRLSRLSEMKQAKIKEDALGLEKASTKPKHHPAFGALKGMITLLPDVDLTEPAYPDWKKLYGEDE